MKICKECKNINICKWIDERDKLLLKLEKISLKEGCPFLLECNCNSFIPVIEEVDNTIEEEKSSNNTISEDL